MPLEALRVSLLSQVRALQAEARAIGASVDHIKPHGSLYNDAARDGDLARLVVDLCTETGIGELLGPPDSALQQAAEQAGLRFVPEGFADRLYEADGTLTPRSVPGAVIEDGDKQLRQSLGIVRDGEVFARTGERVPLQVATICLHGDTPGAADNAAALRAGLEAHGIIVQP